MSDPHLVAQVPQREAEPVAGLRTVLTEGAHDPRQITVDGVEMRYGSKKGGVVALEATSLMVARSSFTSIVGPSGCGKSTLLKVIAGLVTPTAGSVSVAGRPAHPGNRDIGIMFQSPVLLPWRSVLDNVLLPLDATKSRTDADVRRARELLEEVRLSAFERLRPAQLSGGMQQRVALCRALISQPKVLLFDEPFGAVDALTREQLNDLVMEICATNSTTAVLVTHDIDEAVYMGDEVVVMSAHPGRVVEQVEVPLPRPRDYSVRLTPEFTECASRVHRRLREHS